MVTPLDVRIAKQTLHNFMDALFNEYTYLNPLDWKIYVGYSKYTPNKVPQVPVSIADRTRAERLGFKTAYFVTVENEPVKVARLTDHSFEFYFPQNPKDSITMSTYLLKRRADLVLDDVNELNACGFPYTAVATNLTQEERTKVYGKTLSGILQPQSGIKQIGGFFESGEQFLAAVVEKATYNPVAPDPFYYAKWRSGEVKDPKNPVQRVFSFDNLTDEYLLNNFYPFELEKAAVYLVLRLKTIGDILIMLYDNRRVPGEVDLHYETLLVPPAFQQYGDIFSQVRDRIRASGNKWADFQNEAWIFNSLEGTDQPQAAFSKETPSIPNLKMTLLEQVVDPKFMFQSIRGLPIDQIDDEQKKWCYKDWLKQLVRLCFASPWVSFWNNSYQKMYYTPDRKRMFLDELNAKWKNTPNGPMRDMLQAFLKRAEQDQGMLFVRRGSTYGDNRRVVGSDESFVYFYNNKKQLLTRMPMYSFWGGVNITQISADIYENTKGLIPIIKFVTIASTVVVAIAVIGPATIIQGAREYLVKRVNEEAISLALDRQFKAVRNRLVLMFVNSILGLFYDSSSNTAAQGTVGFIKGFIQGFTYDSFVALFKRWDSFAMLEPSSIRTLRLLARMEAAIQNLDDKLSKLADVVDKKTAELLAKRFVGAFAKVMTAVIGIIDNLYFLEYDKVKVVLDALADMTGDPPPTRQKWDQIRHWHLLETLHGYTSEIQLAKADIKDLYDEAKQGVNVLRKALLVGETTLVLNYASGGLLFKSFLYALGKIVKYSLKVVGTKAKYAGPGLAAATVAVYAIDEKFRDSTNEVVIDLARMISKGADFVLGHAFNPDKLEKMGQVAGQLWGATTLNKAVFGNRGSIFQRWKTEDYHTHFVVKETIVKDLTISLILPSVKLVLFNYVYLIEKVIEESKQGWDDLQSELEKALTVEDEFKDILEEDKVLTLGKIVLIISKVRNAIRPWLKKLSQIPGLTDKMGPLIEKLKKTSPSKIPTFDDLRSGEGVDEWARELIMFVALSHLETSLQTLLEAIKDLEDPVNPDSGSPVSISFLLRLMGFHLNDQEASEVLDRNFNEIFKDKP